MGNVQTESVSYRSENKFRVVVDGTTDAGTFTKAGPLMKAKIDMLSIRTGTSMTEESKEPGNVTFEDVTLTQGVSANSVLRDWFNQLINNGGVTGSNGPVYKRIIRIEQLDRDETTVLESYTYKDAWLVEYDDGSFDADSGKFRMREVKFTYLGKPTYKLGA